MFHMLIDTSVWLDLGRDYSQKPLLEGLEQLIRKDRISLILPRTVVEEFARSKGRVLDQSSRTMSTDLKRAKEWFRRHGDPKNKKAIIDAFDDIDHRMPSLGEIAAETFSKVEDIFKNTKAI